MVCVTSCKKSSAKARGQLRAFPGVGHLSIKSPRVPIRESGRVRSFDPTAATPNDWPIITLLLSIRAYMYSHASLLKWQAVKSCRVTCDM